MSWVPTLQQLLVAMAPGRFGGSAGTGSTGCIGGGSGPGSKPLVCCFTDFNAEAVHRARQLCSHLLAAGCASRGEASSGDSGGVSLEAGLHPFRKPAAVLAADHALPSASNGFALWLIIPPQLPDTCTAAGSP